MDGVQLLQDYSHFEEAVYFITLSSQKFLVLIFQPQPWSHPMVLTMRLLDWESSTLTTRPLRLTPSFPKCWIEKKRTIQYAAQ